MELPDKVYFRIGEVAKALGVQPHVVRFWQQQFPTVKPERSRTGRFLYTRKNVEQLARIQKLLKKEGYTIAGARKAMRGKGSSEPVEAPAPAASSDELDTLKARIAELETTLEQRTAERDEASRRLTLLRGAVVQHTGAAMRLLDADDGKTAG